MSSSMSEMEKERDRLNKLIEEGASAEEILKQSKLLDEVIAKYYLRK